MNIKIIEVSNAHAFDEITVSVDDFLVIQKALTLSRFRHTIHGIVLDDSTEFYWHTQDTVGVSV